MSNDKELGMVLGKMDLILDDVKEIKSKLDVVYVAQKDQGHDIKDLSARIEKIEPIVTKHEDVRKYTTGAMWSISFVVCAVCTIVTNYAKPVISALMVFIK